MVFLPRMAGFYMSLIVSVIAENDGHKVTIPCVCRDLDDFYQGYFLEFENSAPVRQGRYSMPDDLQTGYAGYKKKHQLKLKVMLFERRQNSSL